ncbi:Chaperone protein dnaJ 1, mitochondrial [Chionoecetes opilio]|uniref:Chaperone protein dnaJ 1, mitochondrial n=1 Tax=Chionoecetes opilio TaxID=41210 RepID=A0A8J4YE82_CHIOP|nr:Chaperone protein dnaJ 1, mitochondrial [Chionoecetes opilio]
MWLRQYSVHEILSLREGRQCSLLLRLVLNASRRQVLHASHMRKPPLGSRQTNYYEVLDIAPKATQAQVKDAYYSLSKKYHPDHYKGDEDPSMKFREIKEAYEILGDFSQRKMYDKGLLGVSAAATPAEAEQYSSRFYESRRKRGAVPSASGRTPIYNFDEWSKYHYDSSRMRRGYAKIKYEDLLKERAAEAELKKTHSMISVLLLFGIMLLIQYSRSQRHDSEKTKSK